MRPNKYEYDAFISHAVEDKIPIANELCAKLERAGLKIWYSGKELGVGDSIEKTIQKGLNRSRYGIVIFSPTYLAKNWTIREFYTLLAKEIEEQKVILPVLYNVTLDDLKNKDLVMADRFAVNADRGIDFVVDRLVGEIKKSNAVQTEQTWFAKLWFFLILSLIVNIALLLKGTLFQNTGSPVTQEIPSYHLQGNESYSPATNPMSFLGEVQGLLTRLSPCHCNPSEDENNAHRVYQAGFNENHDAHSGQALQQQPPGRKMTMAVVFQMETFAEASREAGQEIDRLMSNVSTYGKNNAFVKAMNPAPESVATNVHCAHAPCQATGGNLRARDDFFREAGGK